MTHKEIEILKQIYYKTLQTRFTTLEYKTLSQGKRFYQRVRNLESSRFIQVVRSKGENNIYRLTDRGYQLIIEYDGPPKTHNK